MARRRFEPRCFTSLAVFEVLKMCCYGFVLMSSGVKAYETEVFEPGGAWTYELHSGLLMNEKDGPDAKDVGFYTSSKVTLKSVWGGGTHERLLKIEMQTPKLHIRSRKVPTPEGFVRHTSVLDSFTSRPFYVLWNKGKVEKLIFSEEEPVSLVNLKKGFASLLQFQVIDQEQKETDASGTCTVSYTTPTPTSIVKTKKQCTSPDLVLVQNPKPLLDTIVVSEISSTYEFANGHIQSIMGNEKHVMTTAIKEEIGNEVLAKQEMTFVSEGKANLLEGKTFEEVHQALNEKEGPLVFSSLLTEVEILDSDSSMKFSDAIKAHREHLKAEHLGTVAASKVFMQLVGIARKANKEEISRALEADENQRIINQLYDILGYVQTSDSHAAAMKKLHFDDSNQKDLSERYLWALSVYSQPNPDIITDLLHKYKNTQNIPEHVKETLILSIASMAYNLNLLETADKKIHKQVEVTILNQLEDGMEHPHPQELRALRNLRSKTTIPKLMEIVTHGHRLDRIMTWRILKYMDPKDITEDIVKAAIMTFYQINKHHDSSERTLAFDIIMATNPDESVLRDFVRYLRSNDEAFEIKKYVIENFKMYSQLDAKLRDKLTNLIWNDPLVNNYHVLGQAGFSMALAANVMNATTTKGRIQSVHEVDEKILKRGTVDLRLDRLGASQDLIALEIFTGGLASAGAADSGESSEDMTAGIEISLLGTQVRPFTFFTGQGELMGHVWSGTASDRTSAFQGGAMLQDHLQYLRLGPGFVAEIDLKGSGSFDLSGQIQISLWNKNADGYVEKSGGGLVTGIMKVESSFVRSHVEFSLSIEPKLRLETFIDFYSTPARLCLKLVQPDSVFKHSVYKIERIPGSKHRLRITKSKKYPLVGKCHSLSKLNSDACKSVNN